MKPLEQQPNEEGELEDYVDPQTGEMSVTAKKIEEVVGKKLPESVLTPVILWTLNKYHPGFFDKVSVEDFYQASAEFMLNYKIPEGFSDRTANDEDRDRVFKDIDRFIEKYLKEQEGYSNFVDEKGNYIRRAKRQVSYGSVFSSPDKNTDIDGIEKEESLRVDPDSIYNPNNAEAFLNEAEDKIRDEIKDQKEAGNVVWVLEKFLERKTIPIIARETNLTQEDVKDKLKQALKLSGTDEELISSVPDKDLIDVFDKWGRTNKGNPKRSDVKPQFVKLSEEDFSRPISEIMEEFGVSRASVFRMKNEAKENDGWAHYVPGRHRYRDSKKEE